MVLAPPLVPMLARAANELPRGQGWLFEPKWDGFRALLFRDRDEVALLSRNGRPLHARFPEVAAAVRSLPERCVLDGEIAVATRAGLDFDALLRRFDGRAATAATFVAFDLLCAEERDLRDEPFAARRSLLEASVPDGARVLVTPQTDDRAVAQAWLEEWGARGFEGVVAKRASGRYLCGRRTMVKVKSFATADLVVGGYRGAPGAPVSLLLGAYDRDGALRHVGHTTVVPEARRAELAAVLAPYEGGPSFSGGPSPGMRRWDVGRAEWWPLRPELVCEVAYTRADAGGMLRHGARFLRWRPDKAARDCTLADDGALL